MYLDPFTVYVTCGPYATCDNDILSYTPLDDLCNAIKTEAPDVVIMVILAKKYFIFKLYI